MDERGEGGRLEAGEFSTWLREMRSALDGVADMHPPCGECCACCSTSHFVHVAPDEQDVAARVPRELLFRAPGLPLGHAVLPYDSRGRCPMLDARGRCSIYDHRPRTCRTYDCRAFAAAGIDADRAPIISQVMRWRFTYADERAREEHAAVRAAAQFVREHAAAFPSGAAPEDPAQLAVVAIRSAHVFLSGEGATVIDVAAVASAIVRAASQGRA